MWNAGIWVLCILFFLLNKIPITFKANVLHKLNLNWTKNNFPISEICTIWHRLCQKWHNSAMHFSEGDLTEKCIKHNHIKTSPRTKI
jgi:hypothetical protein